jgi:hypothetical protein
LLTAVTGIGAIATANPLLTGAGATTVLYTAGQSGGRVKSVIIKATVPVTTGMVRLFIRQPVTLTTVLYKEIQIPITPQLANTPIPRPVLPMFETTLVGDLDLEAGYILLATTQIANAFNVVVEAFDWDYPSPIPTDCCNFKQEIAVTGVGVANTANTFLNGSGNIATVFEAAAATGSNGTLVKNMTIKAQQSTSINGMLRIFISPNGVTWSLIREIEVPETQQSAFEPSWKHVLSLNYNLAPEYFLGVSTELAEGFAITVEGASWSYPI